MINQLILVLNCGSSSIKFVIIDPKKNIKYISGIAECLNIKNSCIKWKFHNTSINKVFLKSKSSHKEALIFIINNILKKNKKIFKKIIGIGHRIVHGGINLNKSIIINNEVLKKIKDSIIFAPLHNPSHLIGIYETKKLFPNLSNKQVAVFDTNFYKNMPKISYLYAIPYLMYKKHGIRRYGAHGISHNYVIYQASKILKKSLKKSNFISCHLGNGGSISAIKNGICIDTSMGLTPLEGLVMGTRSGDIDPSIIFYLNKKLNMSINEIEILLTKKSGLLGLTNITSDLKYIENNYFNNKIFKRAIDIYCYRLSKYIGSYSVLMKNKIDALIFTGGIGENSSMVRLLTLKKLKILGFKIDKEKNLITNSKKNGIITTDKSRIAIVISTDEEIMIAKETLRLII
ncbi:acetate kinase [Sodalis-like secondary symbiont of Drepanosiphum platanoidis]|uniref:acetate kinase n=1 Tax=Sodalis-like secondary symbiont of Drepanosiphum platanoidis TaxID=2994493 RepID=UPI003464852D